MTTELHQTLLKCGYRYLDARQRAAIFLSYPNLVKRDCYIKTYGTNLGEFEIILIIADDPSIELPIAYAHSIASGCSDRLVPHLADDRNLCYVDQMESDWNPNNISDLYAEIDRQVQLTLDKSMESLTKGSPDDRELEGELSGYWSPEDSLFLLADVVKNDKLATSLYNKKGPSGEECNEFVTTHANSINSSEIREWCRQRGLELGVNSMQGVATHIVKVTPTKLAGVKWPPKSLKDLLDWLLDIDHNARNSLIQKLFHTKTKRNFLLMDVQKQGILGAYVEIDFKKQGFGIDRKRLDVNKCHSMLSVKLITNVFVRLDVTKAGEKTLFSRNQHRIHSKQLSDMKIALIGCGTIGGYLSHLLVGNGAGCGTGCLHLYDHDSYQPHNFGRHCLTAKSFGKNKALELASDLIESLHLSNSISGLPAKFAITSAQLKKYDIVIDATGRPPISKRLAAVLRDKRFRLKTILVHVFNDGNGRASKVFVDSGEACYGCMVGNPTTHIETVDKRFQNINHNKERHISCGSTYVPYDAAVSHVSAALALESTLNSLEEAPAWNYSEHMFDGSRSSKPRLISQLSDCPICHD